MFDKNGNRAVGMVIHLMMGLILAVVYAALWSAGLGGVSILWGAVFGAAHWLVAGLMMGGMGMMHAGVKAGTVDAPGVYMTNNGGMMAFMGGLIGHIIYGVIVALVYSFF